MPYDPQKDPYRNTFESATNQARQAVEVTPSDGTDLAQYAKALYIGVSGDLTIIPLEAEDDTGVLFKDHPAGYMPVMVRRVLATGTSATNIVALTN